MDGDVERRAIVSIHPSRREPGARAEAARGARPYSAHPTAVHPVRARLAAAARHVAAHGAAPHRHRAALGGGRAPRAAGDKRHSRGSQRDLSRYRHRARLRSCAVFGYRQKLDICSMTPIRTNNVRGSIGSTISTYGELNVRIRLFRAFSTPILSFDFRRFQVKRMRLGQ